MKKFIHKINKAFENRVRLSIMALLMIHEELSFNQLKEWLEVSDGNLASHIQALEKAEYLIVLKQFIDKKPNTSYKVTKKGKKEFKDHIDAIEQLIKDI